jgi:hypothetical protein
MDSKELLNKANQAFRNKDYRSAVELYQQYAKISPVHSKRIAFNIQFVESRLSNSKACTDLIMLGQVINKEKIIVYTVNVGGYESVKEPLAIDPTVEYLLFTDDKTLTSEHWKVIQIERKLADPRRTSRLPKILAHKYLPDHDISVYIDSSLEIKTPDVRKMVAECLGSSDISLYRHYKRDCVYDEIKFVMNSTDRIVSDKDICIKALKKYEDINYPKNNGLFENAFIIRRNSEKIRKLNETWWSEYDAGAERDQFVFMYALNKIKVNPTPIKIGKEFRDNPFVNFYKHNYVQSCNRKKLAIAVHVYYLDVWERIEKKLINFKDYSFDLFVTSSPDKCKLIKISTAGKFDSIKFLEVENQGMDVLPFIKAIKAFNLDEYDSVLKLHTKNEKTSERKIQGEIIFSSLLNKTSFTRAKAGNGKPFAIFPGFFARSIEGLMYGNRKYVEKIIDVLEIKTLGSYFSAGTMFWISGSSLNILKDNYDEIEIIFNNFDDKYQTGGDGSPAHAFERVFGKLINDENLELSFRLDSKDINYTILNSSEFKLFNEKIANAGSTDHIYLYESATFHAHALSQSSFFEVGYYKEQVQKVNFTDISVSHSPAVHAILYGELLGLDPCKKFSTIFYKLSNQDVLRARKSAIGHFIANGQREKHRKFYPTYRDARGMLILYNFAIEIEGKLSPKSNFKRGSLDVLIQRIESTDLDILLNESDYQCLLPFMINILDSYYEFQAIKRSYQNLDWITCEVASRRYLEKFGESKESIEAIAASLLLNRNFEKSLEYYKIFWDIVSDERFQKNQLYGSLPYDEDSRKLKNNEIFSHVVHGESSEYLTKVNKICFYTTLYGGFDTLPPILTHLDNVDFICFSDRDYANSDWKIIVVPPEFEDDNLNAKRFKILPHKYLRSYDASVFVDANTYLYGNLEELVNFYLHNSDFAMFKHPDRDDLYKEVAAIIGHRRHSPEALVTQIKEYFNLGLPSNSGLVEGSFIWRKHNNEVINKFMEEWWSHILKYSKRDQLSLGFLMWKNNLRPRVLPDSIGNSRTNIYFKKFGHQKDQQLILNNNSPKELVFLYCDKYKRAGSTVMRGFQLFDIVNNEFKQNGIHNVSNVKILNESFSPENSFLYLTKGFLKNAKSEVLEVLKRNGNILLADYVDDKVRSEHLIFIDVMIAASITAFIEYKSKYPDKNVKLLTHHVDPRVESACRRINHRNNKAAYFGEVVNTILNDDVKEFVDLFQVDTSGEDSSTNWIDAVPCYKYHYAVRNRRAIDGFKPFTKGFTAACASARIILDENVDDVKYYLGANYPFYIDTENVCMGKQVGKFIQKCSDVESKIADSYMMQVRKRSSKEFILSEFKKIIASV